MRNMKSMLPPSTAIFFMIYFYRTGWHDPLAPWIRYCTAHNGDINKEYVSLLAGYKSLNIYQTRCSSSQKAVVLKTQVASELKKPNETQEEKENKTMPEIVHKLFVIFII